MSCRTFSSKELKEAIIWGLSTQVSCCTRTTCERDWTAPGSRAACIGGEGASGYMVIRRGQSATGGGAATACARATIGGGAASCTQAYCAVSSSASGSSSSESRYPSKSSSLLSEAIPAMYSSRKSESDGKTDG